MRGWLIAGTVVEVLLVVAVLAFYLVAIGRSLRRTATLLGKVAFGVRAIETQVSPVGPTIIGINEQLEGLAAAFDGLAGAASSGGSGSSRGPRRGRRSGG